MRGYFGIGIWNPQYECNMGTLFRSAYLFNTNFLFTIGRKYKRQSADTVDARRHIPFYNYESSDDFFKHLPTGARLIAVENVSNSYNLSNFVHPEQAIYILGSECQTLPQKILDKCYACVKITTPKDVCMNVSVAGSILLYDRFTKNCG